MIYRLELLARRLRRWLSRSEWSVRFLGLPVSEGTAAEPGLILVQIDGLSYRQLETACQEGRMPFLARLRDKEMYRLYHHYSGLPSNTPAVQGELYYGVKGAVPAFSFLDRRSGKVRRMFDPEAASLVERSLMAQGEPLLQGGSSYSNIFTGGAAEPHFCPAALGWHSLIKGGNPFALAFLVLTNVRSVLRMAVLLGVEVLLAIADFVRGLIDGLDLFKELKFVPTRVVICILLRELITIGAELDTARGLPIIHLNYLGYDEQAHRRGPTSRFARWSLKGIDGAIKRLWHAAKRSHRRNYDVWVFSDHGQEEVVPYQVLCGRSIDRAVAEVFEKVAQAGRVVPAVGPRGEQSQRVRLLTGGTAQRVAPAYADGAGNLHDHDVALASMGPIALVYLRQPLAPALRAKFARDLIESARVPLVLALDDNEVVKAWTRDGEFALPEESAEILGADHPYLEEVSMDLVALCRHRDSGDFVLGGWAKGIKPCSFPLENGAHGGPGAEETGAFALLPRSTPLRGLDRDYLRPADLRAAARQLLSREVSVFAPAPREEKGEGRHLRLMTYNVHGCVGMDGNLSPERIARVIAEHAPDVVALQELDVGRSRSGRVDQAVAVARHLEMTFHFHPVQRVEDELYGNALLSRLPMRLIRAGHLPNPKGLRRLEPRGALWVAVDAGQTEVQIINTHLGLLPGERRMQVAALLGDGWLGNSSCTSPRILCGDFNALPSSPVYRRLARQLTDVQESLHDRRPLKTYSGRYPAARIDHVFIDGGLTVCNVEVPSTHMARVASDHLPLIADLLIADDLPRIVTCDDASRRRAFEQPAGAENDRY